MEISFLEEMANKYSFKGITKKSEDIFIARKYFAISLGFNRYLERTDFIFLCRKFLEYSGLTKNEMADYEKWGCEMVSFGLDLTDCVRKIFDNSISNPF